MLNKNEMLQFGSRKVTQTKHQTLLKILEATTRSAIFPKNLNNKSISTFYLSCALFCFSV